ncbi:lysozyme inhibitor LprI family protein, partial [Enterobacteriaceae bacterium H18W14]
IKANIDKQCTATVSDIPAHRWDSIRTLKNMSESEVCAQGAPTKAELLALMREDKEFNAKFDKEINEAPPEVRTIMEEGAKVKGTSVRNLMFNDIAINTAKNWEIACTKQSKSEADITPPINTNNTKNTISDVQEKFNESDKKLNVLWKSFSSDTRKKLLPEQRKWIKQKDNFCKTDINCLTDMTNKRIADLSNRKASE